MERNPMRGPSHDHVGELYLSVNKPLGQLQDPFVSPWTRKVMAPALSREHHFLSLGILPK